MYDAERKCYKLICNCGQVLTITTEDIQTEGRVAHDIENYDNTIIVIPCPKCGAYIQLI